MSWDEFLKEMNKLPKLVADPAPWGLNKSGVSVDTGIHGEGVRVRQEGGRQRKQQEGNARLIAGSATHYNLIIEALYAMGRLAPSATGRDEAVTETMGLICDALGWIHDDPKGGQGLRIALELPNESPHEDQRPRYPVKPTRKKRVSKTKKR